MYIGGGLLGAVLVIALIVILAAKSLSRRPRRLDR
jgi:hypothetical protein